MRRSESLLGRPTRPHGSTSSHKGGAACHALHDGQGYYFDNNHLTNTAALALSDLFVPVFTLDDGAGS